MSGLAQFTGRVGAWLTDAPAGFDRAHVRYYVSFKVAYIAGASAHMGFLVIFWLLGQDVLAAFNIFSVTVLTAAIFLHLNGRMVIAFHIVGAEVLAHAVLATVYLGWHTGFTVYALAGFMANSIAPFITRGEKVAITCLSGGTFVALAAYGLLVAPLQPVSLGWVVFFQLLNSVTLLGLILSIMLTYQRAVVSAETELEAEHEKSEALLHNILPVEVAERLKENPELIADSHNPVTILFADIVGFTELSSRSSPKDLVALLNDVFRRFDTLVDAEGIEKIKTIGDAYMVVAGLPRPHHDHAAAVARLALAMMAAIEDLADETGRPLQIRVGINSGEVVAGVIGERKFAYDLWGDTVNVAARMESTGLPGRIQISAATRDLIADSFNIETRGEIEVKGKGTMTTYFLTSTR